VALKCVESLIPYNKPFEINVGAMTRGYRTSPYPAEFILKEIFKLGGKIVINGDCHNKNNLGDYLDLAINYAKMCGFKERLILTPNGFISEEI
jgi:histidinol-phosphatase (PHP family)